MSHHYGYGANFVLFPLGLLSVQVEFINTRWLDSEEIVTQLFLHNRNFDCGRYSREHRPNSHPNCFLRSFRLEFSLRLVQSIGVL